VQLEGAIERVGASSLNRPGSYVAPRSIVAPRLEDRNATESSSPPLAKAGALAAIVLALGVSACGGGSKSDSSTDGARPPAPRVTLAAPTHRPVAGAPWPIRISARGPSGESLAAVVRYQYLFGGAVVARRSRYRFRGSFRDTIRWPARSVGLPLTFRAVVSTSLGTRRLDYDVQVKP